MRHSSLPVVAAFAVALTPQAYALEVGLSLFEESEYTTNSGRTERDEVEEWIHSPGATLSAAHDGPNLNLDVDYTLTRRFYQQDLYEDENEAAGSANLVWNALPERLDFTVNHTRTQSAIRSINAATPDNRQETVNTTAGPTLRFNPRGQDQILIQYLWGDRSTDRTDTDAETHNISASYVLAMSTTSNLTLAAINTQTQYENPFIPDLDAKIAQLTWDRQLSNTSYSLMGGYNRTERTLDREDVDGFIFDVTADWQARSTTTLSLNAGRSINDQSNSLGSGTFVDDLDVPTDSDLGEVFTNERIGLTATQQLGGRTTLNLGVIFDREDYEDVARDTDRLVYSLGLNRQLNRQMDLGFNLSFANEDFEGEGDESDTLRGDLTLGYALGRNLNLDFGFRYEERDSASNITSRNYDEWAGFIRISYDAFNTAR